MVRIFFLVSLMWPMVTLASIDGATSQDEMATPAEPPAEVLKELARMHQEIMQIVRERRQELSTQPVERLPSVYYKPVLAVMDWRYVVLGRCAGRFGSCDHMENELKAVQLSACRTLPILLDASLNKGYEDPETVFGLKEEIIFVHLPLNGAGYQLTDIQPQSVAAIRELTCD